MTKVFISYSRKDKLFARKLVSSIQQGDLEAWIDWEDIPPSSDWRGEIQAGIEEADGFLFLLSPDSIQSEVCREECAIAVQNGKRLIPIVVREVDHRDVPLDLAKINWIYCREQDDFDEGIGKILSAISTDLEWVKFHRQLLGKALEWDRGQDPSLLLRGRELREAERQLAGAGEKDPQPTDLQRQYVLASRTGETRNRNRLVLAAGAAVVVLLIATIFAVLQRNVAISRQLAAQAKNQLEDQPDLATLLSIESYRSADTFESRDMLFQSIMHTPRLVKILPFPASIQSVQFRPDAGLLAVGLEDGSIELWDTRAWARKRVLSGLSSPVRGLFFNDRGEALLAIHCSSEDPSSQTCQFQSWDLDARTASTLSTPEAYLPAAASPDGKLLAFTTNDGLQLWDIPNNAPLGEPFNTIEDPNFLFGPWSLTFSPDGKYLLAGGCGSNSEGGCRNGVIEGWDLSTLPSRPRSLPPALATTGNAVESLRFGSPETLAAGSCIQQVFQRGNCPRGEVSVWRFLSTSLEEVRVERVFGPLVTQSGPITGLRLNGQSPGILAASGQDNRVYLSLEPAGDVFQGYPWETQSFLGSRDTITDLAIDPGGHWLAVSGGETLTLWDLRASPLLVHKVEDLPASQEQDLSAENQIVAAGLYIDGSWPADGGPLDLTYTQFPDPPQLLNLKTGQPVSPPLAGFPFMNNAGAGPEGAGAISPDGRFFAAANSSDVILWDLKAPLEDGNVPGMVLKGGSGGLSLAFSPDGRSLAAGGESGGITIWNLADSSISTRFSPSADTPFTALAFSPDARLLAAATCLRQLGDYGGYSCENSEIHFWNLASHQPFGPTIREGDGIQRLRFAQDGHSLAVGDGSETWNFNVEEWPDLACLAAGRNFTLAEWRQFFPGQAYRQTCPQYPAAGSA